MPARDSSHRPVRSSGMSTKNILITGRPGVGKSTIIHRVVERLRLSGHLGIGGFYTLEMSREGRRSGFAIHTLDGRVGRLAEVGLESRFRLGKYGIEALDAKPPVLATIMRSHFDFPDAIKARNDVMLMTVTADNRDRMVEEIVEIIRGYFSGLHNKAL